ncbi:predicted protein [Nematostella vectensis]|uniref:Uncharacterized protein n=2 Tax=Nematostella vectensis TaxID=45351 RepID=A7SWU3_NEMVE|nr:predicted protein [Nematostella vectensis]|eukprot:XP_001623931.1 predicted protein [Nematostella vectensis]
MVCQEGGVLKLTICNEAKQNALTIEMCEQLVAALHEASKDDVNVVVIIGAGKYFCSGLDYTCVFTRGPQQKQNTKLLVERFKLLVEVIIHCSKPIIAAVNGDAKGFGTSLVALCDIVYVCEKINLELSFTKWGHTPIGCCTYTLPQAVGHAGAYGMLLFSTKMSAEDAWMNGLASETLDSDSFTDIVSQRAKILAAMNTKCIQDTKSLLQGENQQRLKNINAEECNLLQKYLLDERGVAALATAWKEDVMG